MIPGTAVVDLDQLRFGLSPRKHDPDPDLVSVLAEILEGVPPIVVQAPSLRVIDGVHRVLAAQSRGWTSLKAQLFHGDDVAAAIEAVRCNVTHGKPLTSSERADAASALLSQVPGWSDRRLGQTCGLSPKTIARLRCRLGIEQPAFRVGCDGRERPADANETRRRVAAAVQDDPVASIRKLALATGASQGTVRSVKEKLASGESPYVGPRRRTHDLWRTSDVSIAPPLVDGTTLANDRALSVTAELERLSSWVDVRRTTDADWAGFVDAVPLNRAYEVADAVRASGRSLAAFADRLEQRVRG